MRVSVNQVAVFAAASEAFSAANINCSIQESLDRFKPVLEKATAASLPVRGYVSCVLGCPYEGRVPPEDVIKVRNRAIIVITFTNSSAGLRMEHAMMLPSCLRTPCTNFASRFFVVLEAGDALSFGHGVLLRVAGRHDRRGDCRQHPHSHGKPEGSRSAFAQDSDALPRHLRTSLGEHPCSAGRGMWVLSD